MNDRPAIPQTQRKPLDMDDNAAKRALKQPCEADRSDPFATDQHPTIRQLGLLALRRDDINDLFALGDLCALQSLSVRGDGVRLIVYYIGKTLTAYRRALARAKNDVDRTVARRAIEAYITWTLETARAFPSSRNLASALWAGADDEGNPTLSVEHRRLLKAVIETYQRQTIGGLRQPAGESGSTNDDATAADRPLTWQDSDAAMTVADVGDADDAIAATAGHTSPPPTNLDDGTGGFSGASGDRAGFATSQATPVGEFTTGDRIDGRYEIAEVLWGGMGVVYLCYDNQKREPVAVKSFQGRFLDNQRAIKRFTHEALTWLRLEKHRHIVQALLVHSIQDRPHIVLEHISGPEGMGADLRSWIDRGRINLTQALTFALHIALGMKHATDKVPGLVHRDLKPANILVTHEGIAKVTDFGLVRSIDLDEPLGINAPLDDEHIDPSDRLTRGGAIVGTAPYISPEQAQSKDVDSRSDIYAFGAVLYEMLTGQRVFQAQDFDRWLAAHINQQPAFDIKHKQRLPRHLQALVMGCLEKNPNNRPPTWEKIVDELTAIYTDTQGEPPVLEITGPALKARELLDKGYSLTALERYDEALEAYEQAIQLQPDYAWAWARKGRTLRLLERYDEALACYDHALSIDPQYAWAWNGKGIILDRTGHIEGALECFETATELYPDDVWYWYNRADATQSLGRLAEAVPLLERGLQIAPGHAKSWAKLGQLHRTMSHYQEAIDAYEQAIRLEPTYAWAHNGCGLSHKALGRTREALDCFRRATRYQPDDVWHWYNLADALVEVGQYQDAVQPAIRATQCDPTHVFSWSKLGQVLRYVGRYDEALDAYNRAIMLEPESAWAINGKGIVLENMGRHEEAMDCYRQAAAIRPEDIWHWYNQGNVLVLLGRYAEAVAPLQQAVSINPKHARSWTRLAHALNNTGQHEAALKAAQNATHHAARYAWSWGEMGAVLEALGRYDQALDAYHQAADLDHKEPFYVYKQADVLMHLKRHGHAHNLLEDALLTHHDNAQIWAQLGQVLRRLGRHSEALARYDRAVEIEPHNHWAWSGRGLTLSALGRHEEARECFQAAIDTNDADVWYHYNLADELITLNQLEDALEALTRALAVDGEHAESWAKRGQALRKLRRYDAALTAFDTALKINPRYAWAWNGRGLTLKMMNRREEALANYERAAQEDPKVIGYVVNQIDILIDLENVGDALDLVDYLLTDHTNNAVLWARRGQILRRMRRHEEAIYSYDEALALDTCYAWAWNGKGLCLGALERWPEAVACYETALQQDERDVWFWHNYGEALLQVNRRSEAREVLQRALAIDPEHAPTKQKLTLLNGSAE